MPWRARFGWLFAFAALVTTSRLAHAGGVPRAFHLDARQNERLLSMNFGLLSSVDGGVSWHFICERALNGYRIAAGERVEPLALFGSDGSIIAASERGLRVSRTQGCTFYDPPGIPISLETRERTALPYPLNPIGRILGLAANRKKGASAFLVAATIEDEAGTTLSYQLYESGNDAASFSPVGAGFSPSQLSSFSSLTVAPSDAARVYFAGKSESAGPFELWASTDGGVSFAKRTIPGSDAAEKDARILAVHPKNADRLFVRVGGVVPGARPLVPEHILLMSDDAGATWQELLRTNSKIEAAAVSPDGETLIVGVGCDHDTSYACNPDQYGIYRTALAKLEPERIHRSPITCLSWNEAGVFACGVPSQWTFLFEPSLPQDLRTSPARPPVAPPQEFVLGSRPNADFTLADPAPLTVNAFTKEVKGPIPWFAERPECLPDWMAALPGGIAYCVRFSNCPPNGEVIPVSSGPPMCVRTGGGGIGGAAGIGGDRGWSGGAGLGGIGGAQWSATEGRACAVAQLGGARFGNVLSALLLAFALARRVSRRSGAHAIARVH